MGPTMEPDMETPRRHYTPEQKVNILRQHLIERTPVRGLCDQHGIAPTLFYQWQKTFFEKGTAGEGNFFVAQGYGLENQTGSARLIAERGAQLQSGLSDSLWCGCQS